VKGCNRRQDVALRGIGRQVLHLLGGRRNAGSPDRPRRALQKMRGIGTGLRILSVANHPKHVRRLV
jgi:hypothetical protein